MARNLVPTALTVLLVAGFGARGENLIQNSSFELDDAGYACARYMTLEHNPTLRYEAPQVVDNTAVQGKRSLRVPNGFGDQTRLYLQEVTLKPNTEYTFSAWLKSDVDKLPLTFTALSVTIQADVPGASQQWDGKGGRFALSKDWKRYEVTFKTANQRYYTLFLAGSSPGACWMDAAQLNEGKLIDYAPKANLEIAALPDKDVYALAGKTGVAPVACAAVNHGRLPVEGKFAVKVTDELTQQEVFHQETPMSLAPGERKTIAMEIPVSRFGTFLVEPSFATASATPGCFAVVGKYQAKPLDLDKSFCVGLHSGGMSGGFYTNRGHGRTFLAKNQGMDSYYELLANMGCRLFQVSSADFASWYFLEPEPGRFDFKYPDMIMELLSRHGIQIDLQIGDFGRTLKPSGNYYPTLPEWLAAKCEVDNSAMASWAKTKWEICYPPMPLWERYLAALSGHYKGRINHYEIMNEPLFSIAPKRYVEHLEAAARKLRANNARVVGLSLSTDFGADAAPWCVAACEAGALDYLDIVSFHPYGARQLESMTPADTDISALQGIIKRFKPSSPPPLWNTELFFLNDDAPHNSFNAGQVEPHMVATRFLLDLGEGVGQSICVGAIKAFKKWLAPNCVSEDLNVSLKPSAIYVTYNALARHFEGAKPAAKIRWPLDSICYVYQRDGECLAAFWKYGKDNELRLKLPLGDQDAELFDLFGNPLPLDKRPIALGKAPYYLTSKSSDLKAFIAKLERAELAATEPVAIHATRLLPVGDKLGVAVIVENRSGARLEGLMAVSGMGVKSDRTPFSLAVGETKTVTLPAELTKELDGQCVVNVAAASRTWSFPAQKLRPVKIYRSPGKSGPPAPLGDNASFSADHDDKNLYLSFNVKDSTPSDNPGGRQPWEQDCVELFLDPAPLDFKTTKAPEAYHERSARLFLLPYAPAGEQLIIWPQALKLNTANVAVKITTNATGYDIDLTLPLTALEIKGKALGFDIQIDDAKGQSKADGKLSWSSQGKAFMDRFGFGFIALD